MFKKYKLKKQREQKRLAEKPKLRKIREITTHRGEFTEVEKIFNFLCVKSRRKSAYRKILDLNVSELEKNIYLIADKICQILISEFTIDKMLFNVLHKLLKASNASAIYGLFGEYFYASIFCTSNYEEFGLFLLSNAPLIIDNCKAEALKVIPQGVMRTKLESFECDTHVSVSYGDKIYLVR